MFDGAGWWARREVKPGKQPPAHYVPVTTDEVTGKTMGWEPIEQSAFAKAHAEAVTHRDGTAVEAWGSGTYELVGPKVNGNPEGTDRHELWAHAAADVLDCPDRTYDGIRAVVLARPDAEGIVFHRDAGDASAQMAKIKARDFPPEAAASL